LGVDRLGGETDQADMFKGKFDADPSELSAATAVTGHVNDQVAGLQQILAREKIAPFRTQHVLP